MSPESVTASEPQASGMSEIARLTGVFFEPKKAFEDVVARPRWIVPMILTILFGLVFTTVLGSRIGWDRVMQQQMESRLEKMTPEQRAAAEQGMEIQKKFAPVIGYVAAVFYAPVSYLIVAGVLLGIVAGIMSTPVKFKQMYAIMCYASMPGLIFVVLAVVVMFLKANPADFNIQNPLAFNFGAFMDPKASSKFLYAVASAFDIFTIWKIVLIAIGIKAAGGKKLSFAGALMAVVVPWGLLVLAGASLAGLFS